MTILKAVIHCLIHCSTSLRLWTVIHQACHYILQLYYQEKVREGSAGIFMHLMSSAAAAGWDCLNLSPVTRLHQCFFSTTFLERTDKRTIRFMISTGTLLYWGSFQYFSNAVI